MHQPELYADISRKIFQQRLSDVTMLVDSLTWSGCISRRKVLDVGCGPGDFTAQELLPRLSTRHQCSLVGVDSEPSMVSYATHKYAQPGVLSFQQVNIAEPEIEATDLWREDAPFDKIFSYYCLHWVKDQSQAVKNLFKLLSQDDGEAILVLVAKDGLAEAYGKLSLNPRWGSYLQDYEKFVWAYQDSMDPAEDFRQLLERTGFTVDTCICETKFYNYSTEKEAKALLAAINPFLNRMAEGDRSDFIQDLFTQCLKSKFISKGKGTGYVGNSKALVVKARKVKLSSLQVDGHCLNL